MRLNKKDLLEQLRRIPEYKDFKRKSRIRSFFGLIIIAIFWFALLNANNANVSKGTNVLLFGGVFLATLFSLYSIFLYFVKKPDMIIIGNIVDVKEKRRTVNEEERLKTRITHSYLVKGEDSQAWGDCIYDYLSGNEKQHAVGERVILFSLSAGNTYIISFSQTE